MTAKRSKVSDFGLYVRELRLSLRNNAGAYGYSVMITCALATLSAIHHPPGVGQIFLFVLGAVVSFMLVEATATRGFRRGHDDETSRVIALGSSLSLISVTLAVGASALCGVLLPVNVGWFAGSFAGSVVYLLVTAIEMSVARRIEEARRLE